MTGQKRFGVMILGMIITGVLLWGANDSAAQSSAELTLTSLEVGVAETGVIEGRIDCKTGDCGGFKLTLAFDRTRLRVEEATVGPYLGDGFLLVENMVDNAAGMVRLAATPLAAPPADAENILFRLTVYGLKPGGVALVVNSLEITGLSGEPVSATVQAGLVTIVETGMVAFFSPPQNNWEIAFVSERDGNPEIYVATGDGRVERRLTNHPALDGGPAWSPNRSLIAFHSARDGNLEIYIMDMYGGNLRRLTNHPAADLEPAWSPDGRQIVFVSNREGSADIFVINADGTDQRRLTSDDGEDTSPAWSPTGDEIVFTSRRGNSTELFLMKTDGSGVQQVSHLLGANAGYPAWSPDGHLLSLTVEREQAADLYAIDWQVKTIKKLTNQSSQLTLADWSPDGRWIAVTAGYDGNTNLFVMDSTGTDLFRLTDHESADYDPAWRPAAVDSPPVAIDLPPAAAEQCFIVSTGTRQVYARVGPGRNRSEFVILPTNQDFRVIGQAFDRENLIWWQIDKEQIPKSEEAASLWVSSDDVEERGDCQAVAFVDAPPIIAHIPASPPDSSPDNPPDSPPADATPVMWGSCGSCDTCGHPGECVTAPDGECVWDPAICHRPDDSPPPPSDGGGSDTVCYRLSLSWDSSGNAWASASNCDGGYSAGSSVSITAAPAPGYWISGWSGTCPGIPSPGFQVNNAMITMNSDCSVHISFSAG